MASLWGELKRRNVVRVAIAYAIVAWLLIEVSATTFPILKLPEWAITLVTVLLLIGFPVALIFAWAFEITPEGLKKEKDVDRSQSITHLTGRKLDFLIIGVLVLALAVFAFERFVLLPDRAPTADTSDEMAATEVMRSIAVLPFVNMSPDPDQEYFSDGLSEELLNLLAKIPELKVIGRTSSFAFKGQNEDLRVIGEKLGVATLLEGSVRKSGDQVRITAQLINVSDGSHLWSDTYNRTLTDIFAVQDDVAAAIINALHLQLGTNPSRGRPTENTEAYSLFLKARIEHSIFQNLRARDLLLEAVALDPQFAEAFELLSRVYRSMSGYAIESKEGQKLQREAAARALDTNPDLIYAKAAYEIGNLETYSHLGAIETLERVVQASPNDPFGINELVFELMVAGYLNEAVRYAKQCVELEPLSANYNYRLFAALYAAGDDDEAFRVLEIYEQLFPYGDWDVAIVDLLQNRDEEAIEEFEAVLMFWGVSSDWVRDLITGARNQSTGLALLEQRIPQIIAPLEGNQAAGAVVRRLPEWYAYFGYMDRYFEFLLDLELTDKHWTDAQINVDNNMALLRKDFTSHPKYLELAERLGLIDVWEQRGPPDFCDKVSAQWVCE